MAASTSRRILRLAEHIDADRAALFGAEAKAGTEGALFLLLSVAFPALTPVHAWQREAISSIAAQGWHSERRRGDLLASLLAGAGDLSEHAGVQRNLRRGVWGEKARIALREILPHALGGAHVDVTARELSALADATFEVALAEAATFAARRFGEPLLASGPSRLSVLGLGKLGGQELNAGSDVDVIFIYDSDDGKSELTLHDHWSRVVRRLVATLETPSEDGLVWRVDLRLRPEGSQGAICNSVAAAERYYETWGRMWERAALLRARHIAGDAALGATVLTEVVTPFVFRRKVDPGIATQMAELVQRSRHELSEAPERDLKLGEGGIREAEFFIQSLQLIWGGREPALRVPGSLAALARLRSRGLVSDREATAISDAYLLLRRIEHCVQWMTGIQTHLLPDQPGELGHVARVLGYKDAESLTRSLAHARGVVSELFVALAPTRPRPPPRHSTLLRQLDTEDPELVFTAEEAFAAAEVGEHLVALARRPDNLLGSLTRERYPDLADHVLDAVAGSADPELAFRTLRSFFGRFLSPSPYIAALANDLRALDRLATVFGASGFVGEAVISRPDLADLIVFEGGQVEQPRDVVFAELESGLRSVALSEDEYERRDAVLTALRRAKRRVMVEVAVADLAGTIATRDATRTLSELADEMLEQALSYEFAGDPSGLVILAVGKLGGREIGYASDLDVLFIYDSELEPHGHDAAVWVKKAQRVIRLVSEPHPAGPGYELDTRLRPSGSHGLLVTSLRSFARYHGVTLGDQPPESLPAVLSSGAAWERQALLRARVAAGDRELGARAIAVAHEAAYERGAPDVEELHRLRMRMETELARERRGRHDLKTGRGGLLDIEFASQWLQMRHGRDHRVRSTDTSQAVEALFAAGYLSRRDYEVFRDGYAFLRRLEQRMHVLHGTSITLIDEHQPGLTQLARRMGFRDGAQASARDLLLESYKDVTFRVRRSYIEVLGLDTGPVSADS